MSIIAPMVRPMVRPMVTAMGEGGQRTPAQIIQNLFAQGQQGFWLPFTDFASISQDAAGTLPYTALEQPVGRVLDRSGRGNHASQVTSSARGKVSAAVVSPPTRPYYLQLDGVDDFYTCGGGGSTTGFYYSDVVQINAGGIIHTLYREAAGGLVVGYSITIRENNKIACHVGIGATWTVVYSTSALVIGTKYHVAVVDDKKNVYMIINGVVEASIPSPAIVSGGSTISLGRISPPSGGFHLNGQITEPIYRAGPPPSAYEREVIRNYQMQKAGML